MSFKSLFGLAEIPAANTASLYYLKSNLVLLIIAALGATPLPKRIYEKIGDRRRTNAGPVSGILIWAVSSAVMRRFFDSQIIVKYVFALPIGIMLTAVCVFLFLRNFGEFYERRNEV